MKKLIIIVVYIIPVYVFSQEIKSNIVDPFTNERTIETSLISMKQGLSTGFGISYTAVNNSYYLNLVGYGKEGTVIKSTDKVWFVLRDGNVIQFNNRVEVYEEPGNKNIYLYHYYLKLDDVETLKNKELAVVRIASGDSRTDIKVSRKISKNVSKLSELFLNEVSKY
jgi:uncharacterized protein YpmB